MDVQIVLTFLIIYTSILYLAFLSGDKRENMDAMGIQENTMDNIRNSIQPKLYNNIQQFMRLNTVRNHIQCNISKQERNDTIGTNNTLDITEKCFYITYDASDGRRLGNCMFNLATLIGLSHSGTKIPAISTTSLLFQYFDLHIETVNLATVAQAGAKRYGENGAGIYSASALLVRDWESHVILQGFFQSWKYFDNVREKVRKTFKFKEPIIEQAHTVIQRINERVLKIHNATHAQKVVFVGVHVRRGDFLSIKDKGYSTPDAFYYKRAMNLFTTTQPNQLVVFVVCSDDIAWTQTQFKSFYDVTIEIISQTNSPGLDLAILSLCNHTIMSVGTFGWWAAWLTNGITVYYADFPTAGTQLDRLIHREDYYYPYWIPMR